MHPRQALLHQIAKVNGTFDEAADVLTGETSVATKNTIYRFRDGVCFAVMGRDGKPSNRAAAIVGMRIVGWLVAGPPPRLLHTWETRSCAVLFRPCPPGEEDASMALTSPTTELARGIAPARLQAFHDAAPPLDSSEYARCAVPEPPSTRSSSASVTRVHPHEARARLTIVPPLPTRAPSSASYSEPA